MVVQGDSAVVKIRAARGDLDSATRPDAARPQARRGRAMRNPPAGPRDEAAPEAASAGMSDSERDLVHRLLAGHASIERVVENLPDGIRSTVTTKNDELVPVLRRHVKQMAEHLETGRPVRMWDPVFRDVFAHADEIQMKMEEIPHGIKVTETSDNPEVVSMIRAHARKVTEFVDNGFESARPPWAGRGRGR